MSFTKLGEATPSTKNERAAFVMLALVSVLYVVTRAWAVPFVNDEARTFFLFNQVGRFQPWFAEWDAANHLLCTALAQVSYMVFGPAACSLRLPSVLAFGLYLWYVWRSGALLSHRPVRWIFWTTMLFMPMLIEFFSLYRGYGMGIAFLLMAVFHVIRYATTLEWIHFLGALVGMLLAAYASATLMVLWASVLVIVALLALRRWKGPWRSAPMGLLRQVLALLFLGVLPMAYLAAVGLELAKQGALYYGTPGGLVQGSLPSLLWPLFPFELPAVEYLFFFVTCGLLVLAFARAMEQKTWNWSPPLVMIATLLVLEIVGRYALNFTSGVLFPVDRAAMHFLPLFVLLFAFAVDHFALKWPALQWAMALLLIFPLTTLSYANLNHVGNWPKDPITEEIFTVAERYQREADRPLVIGSPAFMKHSWALRNMAAGSPLPLLQQVPFGCTGTDLLLVHPEDTIHALGYHRVAGKPTDAVLLYARNTPMPLELLLDTVLAPNPTLPEHWMIWDPRPGSVPADELLLVLDAVITSPARPLEAFLVWDIGETEHGPNAYNDLAPALLRSRWQSDSLRVSRWMLLPAQGAETMSMRVWNARHQELSVEYCRLRVYRIEKQEN